MLPVFGARVLAIPRTPAVGRLEPALYCGVQSESAFPRNAPSMMRRCREVAAYSAGTTVWMCRSRSCFAVTGVGL